MEVLNLADLIAEFKALANTLRARLAKIENAINALEDIEEENAEILTNVQQIEKHISKRNAL
ncbi:hypothetical protein [Helicobacter fennelliae]|uniref:Uncharacterized protein n=1 Tax=Helicobacter fennelliae MRY12-0050 TaxID=1325130 RepID=T1CXZ9_9HELI|nr:hypothetical protein [Helicobacter fennelliae]GAD17836.1 hypothetical protein HFN_0651 [Helicobacter fennelliae MRY12-0050]STP07370.1 Uncharacterised protein [Helicobacter fennelliae]